VKLVYLSPVMWESYYQRPHYMVQYFLNLSSENKVLWVNPYPTRLPCKADLFRKKQIAENQSPLLERLSVFTMMSLPIEPIIYSELLNGFFFWRKASSLINDFFMNEIDKNKIIGVGKPSKFSIQVLDKYKQINSFYDAMDDFPQFYQGISQNSMKQVEKKIARKVNQIIVSSSHLQEKFPKAMKILNGYNMASLPKCDDLQNKKKNNEKKIFGYVGTIGKWFDWNLVINLAKLFPDDIIRLIGPEFIQRPLQLPLNIELYAECTQAEAVEYLKAFDVGLIPFKVNALTQSVDPIKYYEYRGMGLPVISSRFGEMKNKENIVYFDELEKENLKTIFNKMDILNIGNFRMNNDWASRFHLLDRFFSHD
jgi:glycosyltransferase involved in cell wall biosynthesis